MTKSRNTSNVYDIQNELARVYRSPTEPTRDKERLGDLWIVEGSLRDNQPTSTAKQGLIRVPPKPKKHAKLYQLKERKNAN